MVFQTNQKICNGRYTVLSVVGEGRFGITYRTKNLENGLTLIKTLNDRSIHGQDFERLQDTLIKEACKLAGCQSPYIVKVKEPFRENHLWCIPMEYISGESLENYISSKPDNKIPEEEAFEYIGQICQALQEVHRNDLLHLDIRPANILLRIGGRKAEAVLIDFGLARRLNDPVTKAWSREIMHGFTPPELYSAKETLDARTDIYSLGATLYFLLTGKIPPKPEDRKLLKFPDSISHKSKQAILWAMELKKENRPESVFKWQREGLGMDQEYYKSNLESRSDERAVNSRETSPSKWLTTINPTMASFGALLAGLTGLATLTQVIIQCSKPTSTPSPTPTQTINKP